MIQNYKKIQKISHCALTQQSNNEKIFQKFEIQSHQFRQIKYFFIYISQLDHHILYYLLNIQISSFRNFNIPRQQQQMNEIIFVILIQLFHINKFISYKSIKNLEFQLFLYYGLVINKQINQSNIMAEVPESFRAVRVHEYGKQVQVDTIPIPELQKGEFLIRVEAAPINPSDAFFIKGLYAQLPLPVIPGWEGSGVVVKLGDGTPEWLKLGDRVAINARLGRGTFAEYAVGNINTFLKLDEETTFEQAASFYINPLTVIGILDVVQRNGQNVLVQNAAASALGRQLSRYAQSLNIKVINIVRRQEQVEILKSDGAEFVLNESDANFGEQLKNLSEQLKAKILFDPVGGDKIGELLTLLPIGSTAYLFGVLSGQQKVSILSTEILRQKKVIRGFTLYDFIELNPTLFHDLNFHAKLNKLIRNELRTQYQREYGFDQFQEALEFSQKNASNGKVLVRPHHHPKQQESLLLCIIIRRSQIIRFVVSQIRIRK
ncbi:hypothetical protein pb186bvf_019756 [Paramecium bursaria]